MRSAKVAAGITIVLSVILGWIVTVGVAVPLRYRIDPTVPNSRVLRVERDAFSRTSNPSIIVIGSSRAAFGIDPSAIEQTLSLPAKSVVNAGYPGLYQDALSMMVEQNFEYLRKAKIVVLILDDLFGLESPSAPPVSIRTAPISFKDRMKARFVPRMPSMPSWSELPGKVMQAIQTWPESLKDWEAALSSAIPEIRKELYWTAKSFRENLAFIHREYLWKIADSGRWIWSADNVVYADDPQSTNTSRLVAEQYFKGMELRRDELELYARIAKRFVAEKVTFVGFYMPPAQSYVEYREKMFGEIFQSQATSLDAMLRAAGTTIIRCPTAEDCGLDQRIYGDPMHLNVEGAKRFSELLADRLKPLLAAPKN